MVGSTASIRQVEAALRDPRVAAIWTAYSVVLAAAVVMSYPAVVPPPRPGSPSLPNHRVQWPAPDSQGRKAAAPERAGLRDSQAFREAEPGDGPDT